MSIELKVMIRDVNGRGVWEDLYISDGEYKTALFDLLSRKLHETADNVLKAFREPVVGTDGR